MRESWLRRGAASVAAMSAYCAFLYVFLNEEWLGWTEEGFISTVSLHGFMWLWSAMTILPLSVPFIMFPSAWKSLAGLVCPRPWATAALAMTSAFPFLIATLIIAETADEVLGVPGLLLMPLVGILVIVPSLLLTAVPFAMAAVAVLGRRFGQAAMALVPLLGINGIAMWQNHDTIARAERESGFHVVSAPSKSDLPLVVPMYCLTSRCSLDVISGTFPEGLYVTGVNYPAIPAKVQKVTLLDGSDECRGTFGPVPPAGKCFSFEMTDTPEEALFVQAGSYDQATAAEFEGSGIPRSQSSGFDTVALRLLERNSGQSRLVARSVDNDYRIIKLPLFPFLARDYGEKWSWHAAFMSDRLPQVLVPERSLMGVARPGG